jgi:aspartate carbamoyltransferase catalytic subunit
LTRLKKNGTEYTQCTDFAKAIPEADVIYMTRVQKERFPLLADYLRYYSQQQFAKLIS